VRPTPTIKAAKTALVNARMPFDITDTLVQILAYEMLNICDASPELKDATGREFFNQMDGTAWWIEQMNLSAPHA